MKVIITFSVMFLCIITATAQEKKSATKPTPKVEIVKFSPPVILPDSVVERYHKYQQKPLPKVEMRKFTPPVIKKDKVDSSGK